MKTTEKQIEFPELHLIDIDSPFFVGIGYTPSPEEKKELGIEDDDDRPMSILGLTKDEIAGIDCHGNGRKLAELFTAAPELFSALSGMLENYIELKHITLAMARSDAPGWVGSRMTPDDDIHVIAARAAIAKAVGGGR